MKKASFIALFIFIPLLLTTPSLCKAQNAKYQAVFVKKILPYVRSIDNPSISIVYSSDSEDEMQALKQNFNALGLPVEGVNQSDYQSISSNVVLLTSAIDQEVLESFSSTDKLVITNNDEYLKAGYASFALIQGSGRMQLLANLSHIESSGLDVAADLFRLAKVIK